MRKYLTVKHFSGSYYFMIFMLIVVIRTLFTLFYPLNSYQFFAADSNEYVGLANNILSFNFNFDIGRFIRSPLYPFFIALHKIIFQSYWQNALIASQILLSGFTGIYLCLISKELFKNVPSIVITGLLYSIYLPVFYYVYSFTSETVYMFFNVVSIYYLLRLLKENRAKHLIGYGVSFSLAYLTRAEILLFVPFVVSLIFYAYRKNFYDAFKISCSVFIIWFLMTLPWALVNEKIHHSYITSSNGGKYVFYLSNSRLGYADIVETPAIGSPGYDALLNNYNFYNSDYDSIINLASNIKQDAFFLSAIRWIGNNPDKFIKVKICNLLNFFLPGLTLNHHSFKDRLIMFIFTLPFHALFYLGLFQAIRSAGIIPHLWILFYFACMCGFLTLFLYSARFRAYGLEVYFLIYSSYAITNIIQHSKKLVAA